MLASPTTNRGQSKTMAENDKDQAPAKPVPPAADSWTKWVALTTTILAVGAAFSTMKGGGFSTQTQLNTVKATNNWSYFQSKSIKQTARETEQSILSVMQKEAQTPEAKAEITKKMAKCESTIVRYEQEKSDIMNEAKKCERKAEWTQYRGGKFGLAAMFLQVAIMLCAVSALLKKKGAWIAGMCIGGAGMAYLAFGWFNLPNDPPSAWKSPSQVAAETAAKPGNGEPKGA